MDSKTDKQVQTIILDKVRFKIAVELGKAVAQMTTIDAYAETADNIVAMIKTAMLAEKVIDHDFRVEFPYPATWWEYLKLTVLPKLPRWWSRKVNVKLKRYYHVINVKRYIGYPEVNEVLEDRWGRPVVLDDWDAYGGADAIAKAVVTVISKDYPGRVL